MAKIRISPTAKNDLHEIKEYITIELGSPTAAVNTAAKITKAIRNLIKFPDSGAPLSSIVDVQNNYRFFVCGSYLIFYRHENGIVSVLRVVYCRRDYMKILFRDVPEKPEPKD